MSQKTSGLRNDSWTAGQPGELTMTQPRPEKTTTVLAVATASERHETRRRAGPDADRPARTQAGGQAEVGRAGAEAAAHSGRYPVAYFRTGTVSWNGSHSLASLSSVPSVAQGGDRRVHARGEGAVLLEERG